LDNLPPRASFLRVKYFFISALAIVLASGNALGADADKPTAKPAPKSKAPEASTITTNDPVEAEYEKLLDDDDKAQEEADQWIQDNDKFAARGAGVPADELNRRIRNRFEPVRNAYEDFLKRHPNHVKARVAYGSFLGDIHDEEAAKEQLEKALDLDTNNPAIYNNLANIYGHIGPIKKAFEFYTKALALNPRESVYYHNFGTTVYLFRTDAREYYGINEQQVFDKALTLYSNALHFDPTNFPLATDVATTYYGIKPPRTDEALKSWTNALGLAHDELEREGVYIHFARLKLHAGRFDEARAHLNAVTNDFYDGLKKRLTRNLEELENPATNAPPSSSGAPGTNSTSATKP
jgi:tetratricopeptide (TPR) repeat protein